MGKIDIDFFDFFSEKLRKNDNLKVTSDPRLVFVTDSSESWIFSAVTAMSLRKAKRGHFRLFSGLFWPFEGT